MAPRSRWHPRHRSPHGRPRVSGPAGNACRDQEVAGGPGFEPRLPESESGVLPLNYPPSGTLPASPAAGRLCYHFIRQAATTPPSKALAPHPTLQDDVSGTSRGAARPEAVPRGRWANQPCVMPDDTATLGLPEPHAEPDGPASERRSDCMAPAYPAPVYPAQPIRPVAEPRPAPMRRSISAPTTAACWWRPGRRRLPRARQLQPHRPAGRGAAPHRPALRGRHGPRAGGAAGLRRAARPPPGAAACAPSPPRPAAAPPTAPPSWPGSKHETGLRSGIISAARGGASWRWNAARRCSTSTDRRGAAVRHRRRLDRTRLGPRPHRGGTPAAPAS